MLTEKNMKDNVLKTKKQTYMTTNNTLTIHKKNNVHVPYEK